MHPVLIQEQALPDARYQLQLALLPVAIDIEGPASLYTTQHAYQPFLDLVPGAIPRATSSLLSPAETRYFTGRPRASALALQACFNLSLTRSTCLPNSVSRTCFAHR